MDAIQEAIKRVLREQHRDSLPAGHHWVRVADLAAILADPEVRALVGGQGGVPHPDGWERAESDAIEGDLCAVAAALAAPKNPRPADVRLASITDAARKVVEHARGMRLVINPTNTRDENTAVNVRVRALATLVDLEPAPDKPPADEVARLRADLDEVARISHRERNRREVAERDRDRAIAAEREARAAVERARSEAFEEAAQVAVTGIARGDADLVPDSIRALAKPAPVESPPLTDAEIEECARAGCVPAKCEENGNLFENHRDEAMRLARDILAGRTGGWYPSVADAVRAKAAEIRARRSALHVGAVMEPGAVKP